ncbi:hypothetical protein F5148DRAFT_1204797 [Russula earlei]|uniref:Uncharacterized protein n=1 Tax=Russula earlei TaxID=71964 RepID=A0ACC0U8S8_9AGAM|nr:hypothetical protein F5148DRAFT_1204797 [Russula earlei]
MVSFQCDACTDVVKKPKLDRHYGQCRSSFTCIDCSATFPGPADWKVHTSCITEAEKYQKSLYKGPKTEQQPSNGHQRNSQPELMNTGGKYHQSHQSQSGWSRHQYIRNCASGANSTPLGSPRRMSPVDRSAVEPTPSKADGDVRTANEVGKKGDIGAVTGDQTLNGTKPKRKRRKKHDPPRDQENDAEADESTHVAVEQAQKRPPKKMKRSSEKRTASKSGDGETQPPTEGVPEKSEDKKVKKKKEEKREEGRCEQGDVTEDTVAVEDKKRKKKRKLKLEESVE